MGFYTAPFRVHADDLAAFGAQRYLATTRYQVAVWESLLTDQVLAERPRARDEFEEIALLYEAEYNRVLAPVSIGERVAVLVSLEEHEASTVRVCFRVIRQTGDPVACGFRRIVFASPETGRKVPFPPSFAEFLKERADLREAADPPSFIERSVGPAPIDAGLFPDEVRALGAEVAGRRTERVLSRRSTAAFRVSAPRTSAAFRASGAHRGSSEQQPRRASRASAAFPAGESPRRSGTFTGAVPEFAEVVMPAGGIAFVFPGQDSYDGRVLRELYDYLPHLAPYFETADRVARQHLGRPFLPLVHAPSLAEHDERLLQCPELADLGLFLTGVLISEALREKAVRPALLMGHSFGELTALAVAGAVDIAGGLEIVAQRAVALRNVQADVGGMLALTCGADRALELAASLGVRSVTIAVVNHARQTILTGPRDELAAIGEEAPRHGISATPLHVRYAFHSSLLTPASERLEAVLRERPFSIPRVQVYSPTDGSLYSRQSDYAHAIASHLVSSFDFSAAVEAVRAAGCQRFIECGPGGVLTSVIRRILPGDGAGVAETAVPPGRGVASGCLSIAAAIERRAAETASAQVAAATGTAPAPVRPRNQDDGSGGFPVAIVGLGCVLPGASDPDQYWRNVLEGVSGIVEPGPDDPTHIDFAAPGDVIPDKAYSLLTGSVGEITFDDRVPYTREEFDRLARAHQLLALAMAQCLGGPHPDAFSGRRIRCLLGSTGDGIREYDEALLVDGLRRLVSSLADEPESVREAFAAGLMHLPGLHNGDPSEVAPFNGARNVIGRFLGDDTDTVLLDAACASSLYALDLAARQLWNHDSDVILAGGFFSPGPANNALFCQFRGSATTDAFPFDERADGVIFGEGAAVLALKRLPDALAAGDRIYGVIRGAGVSSDGKSPSANVPRAGGQALAVKRAYASCGIDPKTIQFVEAHATSTPVGDATEFEALRSAFGDREGLPPIYLESIKALIGHTGWVAGAASVIKVCRALEERLIPPQYQFNTPGPGIQLAASPFTIPVAACPWPANVARIPRRAGVSGFGFGGTNAHVILEAFEPAYHQQLASRTTRSPTHATMVVVGIGGQFASQGGDVAGDMPPASGGTTFARTALHLPAKRRLLPDALEHLDVTQFLALMGTERALAAIPDWTEHRKEIGVALGLVGKTPRGASTSERIYLDRLRRLITEHRTEFKLEVAEFDRIANKLFDAITHDNLPTNPYTLVGMMPNVATGRVANMFDLNGANLVVDAGALSLLEALRQAELWLAFGDVEIVLTGALEVAARHHPARPKANVAAGVDGVGAEGVCVAALTTPALANQHNWPVLAHVMVGPPGSEVVTIAPSEDVPAKAASAESVLERTGAHVKGVVELALAMDAARHGRTTTLRWAAVEQPAAQVRPPRAAEPAPRRASRAYRPSAAVRTSAAFRASGTFRASGAFPPHESPRRSSAFTGPLPDFADLVIPEGGLAFTFPGQGSYDGGLLRELYDYMPHNESYFEQADEVAQRHFGHSFLALARATSADQHDALLEGCRDLDQLGIFLSGVLIAEALHEKGIRPAVVMGHSFGELAALAVAGAFDVETGLEIVAQRVLALQSVSVELGGMLALSCPPARARELLAALGIDAVTVAVVNHPKQTVLSGPDGELKRIEAEAPKHALSATRLKSRYPFHSPLLAPAAERFGAALRNLTFSVPRIQVYSPIERAPYAPHADLAHTLASHLVRPFDFGEAVEAIRTAGCEAFIECGAGGVLTGLVQRNLPGADSAVAQSVVSPERSLAAGVLALGAERGRRPARLSRVGATTNDSSVRPDRADLISRFVRSSGEQVASVPCPIAVVGMGCIVPGARDVDEFWNNLLEGVSGIVRMEEIVPEAADFLARGDVVADKTYTMLWGYAGDIVRDPRMPYSADEFGGLVRAQQLLANAMAQCLGGLKPHASRTRCLLGASAEGIREYDEAVFIKRLQHLVSELDEPDPLRSAFAKGLADLPDYASGDPDRLATFVCLRDLVERFLGAGTELVLTDVACASSLYAMEIAIRQLRNRESDLIVTGGVFSPGPLLQPLFAQFKGLASTGCYPFDERAEGVIFGEGAAVLALKRLPDALAAGDRIYGVIRGAGVSSDGKSPSANVPRASGQALAMRRAYESAGLDRRTVQMIEAHATSTPVGDATEFQALRLAFGDREGLPPINLQSIKALIGHTGWVAGAASVIKVCRALEERLLPPQYQFETPGTGIELSDSPFTISVELTQWPGNVDGVPRRAGVSGFGFGGTNAHVVVEAFEPAYHEQLVPQIATEPERRSLAVVGVGGLFPSSGGDALSDLPPATPSPLRRAALRLPAKTRLLPDAVEHMDVSQFLTLMAAEKALQRIPEWTPSKERVGVVLGLTGKTPRAIAAIERVFLDNLRRNLERNQAIFGLAESDFARIKEKLCDILASSNPPSNPYTMLGMLPNLAAGRVANLFDLSGPNLVMDAGNFSLLEVLRASERWLASGSADVMLAGALHTDVQRHPWREAAASTTMGTSHEGACMLALATTEMARTRGWPVLAHISVGALGDDTVTLHSAQHATAADGSPVRETRIPAGGYEVVGLAELARAVDVAVHGGAAALHWQHATTAPPAAISTVPNPARVGPVGFYTPVLVPAPELSAETAAPISRILFLVTGAAEWKRLATADLELTRHGVVAPHGDPVPNGISVDLTTDETIRESLVAVDLDRFDAIVCVRNLSEVPAEGLLAVAPERDGLAELLFAVSRQAYERISTGSLAVASLNLGAFIGDQLNPETGVYAGFIKSLARELPDGTIKCVNTDAVALMPALSQLTTELGSGAAKPWEVFYRGGRRLMHKLQPLRSATRDHRPYVDETSVVVATGGGRGVTAVMVEELLERFHCTVVIFGRTDPSQFPQQLLEMDEAALKAYESQFYREATAREPGKKMAEHKRAYERLQAAHEIHTTMRRLESLPGRVAYQSVDVTDAGAVNKAIKGIIDTHGAIDLVVHGAGVQTSVLLPKRKLTDWRRTMEPKLAGLRNIHAACEEHARGPVHYHLLTSAFSYYGNDGQPDYGAANEAMNRLVECLDAGDGGAHWTSLAWLAWAGVGMTRGSEFEVLAEKLGVYPLPPDEGQRIFGLLLSGRATAPCNVLLTEFEQPRYKVAIAAPDEVPSDTGKTEPSVVRAWTLNLTTAPYLAEHIVSGTPTLPGAFEVELAAEAARELRPERHVMALEDASFVRFVRVPVDRGVDFRAEAAVVHEDADETLIHVRLLSDFVHKSGMILQKDIVHFEVDVRLQALVTPIRGPCEYVPRIEGRSVADPYVGPESPVRLKGMFECLHDIVIGSEQRVARFRLGESANLASIEHFLTPAVLIDAMLRFGAIMPDDVTGASPVAVPERGGRIALQPGVNDVALQALTGDVVIVASHPRMEGDQIVSEWVQAFDSNGRPLIVMQQGVGRVMEGLRIRV